MLRPSFVPPADIRRLRDYTRLRLDLTRERTRHKQRMEKLLEDALIKLSTVATDIFGKSGREMIEALISGNNDPKQLAGLARGRMRVKHTALVQALDGRFDDHHADLARILLDQVDGLDTQTQRLTTTIDGLIAAMPTAVASDQAPTDTGSNGSQQQPTTTLSAIARLDEVPGIAEHAAQVIIAELGLDMAQFVTAGHLVSWAKLSPRTIQSGAKQRGGKTGKGFPNRDPRRGRRRGCENRHVPRRAVPAPGQTPRETQSPGRRRPIHPGHRLAPAERPHHPFP